MGVMEETDEVGDEEGVVGEKDTQGVEVKAVDVDK